MAQGTPGSGYPLGWESLRGVWSRERSVSQGSRATVAIAGSPRRTDPRTASVSILGALLDQGSQQSPIMH